MPDPDLPGDVRATIERRVDLLGEDTRRTLAAASVLGRRFELATLAATTRVDPAVLAAALAEAVTAEVVVPEGDDTYRFAHALVEDTLYRSLTPSRRTRLHAAAAEAFERLAPDDPPLAAISFHACCALPTGDRSRAIEWARRAGAEAAERGASEQAVQHYERARDAARADAEPALLCELGNAYESTGQHELAQDAYAAAIEIATQADDAVGLASAALGLIGGVDESVGFNLTSTDTAIVAVLEGARARLPERARTLRALVTARIAGARYDAGEVDVARELSSDALELARSTGDARAIAVALGVRHTSLSSPDALPDRMQLDDELRALGRSFSVQAEVWRIGDLLESGRMAAADAAMDEMRNGALARTQPRTRWYSGLYRTMRALVRGDLDVASSECEAARILGEQIGARTAGITFAVQSLFISRERCALTGLIEVLDSLSEEHPHQPGFVTTATWLRVETGLLEEAREPFERIARDRFASIPRNGLWLPNLRLLTDIAHALDASAHAATLYELMFPYRDRFIVASRVLTFLGSVEHALGLLALTAGEPGRADDHLTRSRRVHTDLGASLLIARDDLARATLEAARGNDVGARSLRSEVRALGEQHGWTDVVRDAG